MFKKPSLIVIFMIVFIDLVGFGIIIPLGPYLATHVGATATQVGFLMAIYSLMQFLFSPFWGKLSDRFGRRPILLISLFGSSLSYLFFAFSTEFWMLIVSRAFAGFCGANISTAMAYIADVTEEKDRSKGMGLVGAAFGLGFIMGPAIGGILSKVGLELGTQPPLGIGFSALGASAICFVNFLFAIQVLKESLPVEKRNQVPKRESRFLLIKKYLVQPTLGTLILMSFISTVAFSHMEATLALFVKDGWGWGLSRASFAFAYVGIISVFTQGYLIRKLMPKFGEPPLLFAGIVFTIVGLAGIGLSTQIWMLVIAVTIMGLGSGMFNPANLGSISLSSPSNEQGATLGVAQSFSALGRIIGPMSGGFIYQHLGGRYPFLVGAFILCFGFLILFRIRKKIPNSQKKSSSPFRQEIPKFFKISQFQFQNLMENPIQFLMIDLREENKNPFIPKANTLASTNVESFVAQKTKDKDQAILIICETGAESASAAEKLSQAGYINIVILDGGTNSLDSLQQ